ncbi:MAG TPA: hypothetical protein VH374_17895 [Polyangia bacterium]|jgi:hypothetical protein|nr:hypothetical protein [Polyangia bacterium]
MVLGVDSRWLDRKIGVSEADQAGAPRAFVQVFFDRRRINPHSPGQEIRNRVLVEAIQTVLLLLRQYHGGRRRS